MLTRADKEARVEELREKFGRAQSVFLVDFRGINVGAQNRLRGRLREEGNGSFEFRVAKNTLLRRAAEGSPVEAVAEHFDGPTAVALSYGEPVSLAKILVDVQKQHEMFRLKGGLVEGSTLAVEEIETLATLPSLDELRAQLIGLIQGPARKLATLAQEPGAQLARLLEARRAEAAGGSEAS